MASTFSGYSIAASGMYTNQAALTVTSHNLANVNTTRYTRQRISSEEAVTWQGTASCGSGTSVAEIKRARNLLLDATYREQNAHLGYWEVKDANLEDVQITLNEFSADDGTDDDGLLVTVEKFFQGWEELAKDPANLTNRQAVLECAASLISMLSDINTQLEALQLDAAAALGEDVAQLNDYASQVAELNSQIAKLEASGASANDLRDQRDALLDSMSGLADIRVMEKKGGQVDVTLGGVYLVQGGATNILTTTGDGSVGSPVIIKWAELDKEAQIASGSIRAYWEEANQGGFEVILPGSLPYAYSADTANSVSSLRQGLNNLITTLATQINTLHSTGMGIDSNNTTGLAFFVPVDSDQPLGSGNIQVNSELQDNTDKIAAGTTGNPGDNSLAAAIAAVADGYYFQFNGLSFTFAGFYQALISWTGTAGSTAASYTETQTTLVEQITNQRQSVASVSIDEEMSNMIMYQNAYSAAARVLNTIDSLLGGLIEELG